MSTLMLYRIILGSAILLALILNLASLEDGHSWGGDFAHYILHAVNIVNGHHYSDGIFMNQSIRGYFPSLAPTAYPPGFPLMLVPIIWLFGINFVLLKVPLVFLWIFWCDLMGGMIREKLDDIVALCACLMLLFSPWFFVFKQEILSDVPFLFFTTWALAVYWESESSVERGVQTRVFALFLVLSAVCLLIRTAGLALFAAAGIHLALARRDVVRALVVAACPVVIQGFLDYTGISDTASYMHSKSHPGWLEMAAVVFDQSIYNVNQIVGFFSHPKMASWPYLWLGVVVLTGVGVVSQCGWRIWTKFSVWYILIYFAMLLFPGRQGPRYVLPVMAVFLLEGLIGLDFIFKHFFTPGAAKRMVCALLVLGMVPIVLPFFQDDESEGAEFG